MRHFYFSILVILISNAINAQTFKLTINNGYGEGNYKVGSRVHIYSNSYPNSNKIFTKWQSSDSNLQIDQKDEWHTIITMPNKDISLNAQFTTLTNYNVNSGNFMGLTKITVPGDTILVNIGPQLTIFGTRLYGFDTTLTPDNATIGNQQIILQDRDVYYYIPANADKLISFFHWTNGSALGWFENNERFESVKHFIHAKYGVIIPQSEERMLELNNVSKTDINNDGFVRFLVEIKNIRNQKYSLTDLIQFIREQSDVYMMKRINAFFKKRNIINGNECNYAYGFSAGASFAEFVSYKLNYKGAACIGNSGSETLVQNTNYQYKISTIFSYGENDNYNPISKTYEIKSLINANCNALTNRNVKTEQYSFNKSPIHPKRFMQCNGITETISNNLYSDFITGSATFNDSNTNQVYFKYSAKQISDNGNLFPSWANLSQSKQSDLENIIFQINGEHVNRSDFDRKIIAFFNKECDTMVSSPNRVLSIKKEIKIYPNPSENAIQILSSEELYSYIIYNQLGQIEMENKIIANPIDISYLPKGIYTIQFKNKDNMTYFSRFIKK